MPAMSLQASGTLGGILTFSHTRRGAIVRAAQHLPRTSSIAQVNVQSMNRFLTEQWSSIATSDQQTFGPIAAAKNTTLYHGYLSHNMTRWRNNLGPTIVYPDSPGLQGGVFNVFTGTPGVASIELYVDITTPESIWATIIRHQVGSSPSLTSKSAVRVNENPAPAPYSFTWLHSPLPSGNHYYRIQNFSLGGQLRGNRAIGPIVVP